MAWEAACVPTEDLEHLCRQDQLLELRDVRTHFPLSSGFLFQRHVGTVKAVDGVSHRIILFWITRKAKHCCTSFGTALVGGI